jgi:hypothetical protein
MSKYIVLNRFYMPQTVDLSFISRKMENNVSTEVRMVIAAHPVMSNLDAFPPSQLKIQLRYYEQ